MYAIFTMRKLHLTQRINDLQFKLMQISQKFTDLSVYAGNVADGVISPSEFLNSPASIFGVNMNFFNNSVPKALFEASQASQGAGLLLRDPRRLSHQPQVQPAGSVRQGGGGV